MRWDGSSPVPVLVWALQTTDLQHVSHQALRTSVLVAVAAVLAALVVGLHPCFLEALLVAFVRLQEIVIFQARVLWYAETLAMKLTHSTVLTELMISVRVGAVFSFFALAILHEPRAQLRLVQASMVLGGELVFERSALAVGPTGVVGVLKHCSL